MIKAEKKIIQLDFFKRLMDILSKRDKVFLFVLMLFSIFISIIETIGVSVIMPFIAVSTDFSMLESNVYLRKVYDILNFDNPKDFIIAFGFVIIFFYIFRSLVNLIYFYTLNKFSESRYQYFAFKLFKKYMGVLYKDFAKKNSSNLTKNIMHESSNLTHLVQNVLLIMSEIFVLLFIYMMLLYVNYQVTLLLTGMLVINGIFLTLFVSRRMKRLGDVRASVQTAFYEVLNRSFKNFKIIKLRSDNRETFQNFEEPSTKLVNLNIKAATLTQFPKLFLEAIGFSLIISIVVYLIWSTEGDISAVLAMLSIFALALYRLLPSVSRIMNSFNSIMFMSKALDIIYLSLQEKNEVLGDLSIDLKEKISLINIAFGYEEGKRILENINITIHKGDKIAFIGESGSGKTTLVDIIMGLHIPEFGNIQIDNVILDESNIASWRTKIGYIPQSIYLFDGTIAENVVFGREYNEDRIISVLEKAHIYNYLQTKDGIETKVGEGGVFLSGGQIQRIAIARALYGNPEILVLDEATSALDDQTEGKIMNEVYDLSDNMTLIVIAHRLSTIDRCNKVYHLDHGRINS